AGGSARVGSSRSGSAAASTRRPRSSARVRSPARRHGPRAAANPLSGPCALRAPPMTKVLVAVAWPYASGPRHIGHAVSTFIPADIFSRYHRMKGDEVLMVGGSDMHGTPVTVRAEEEGVPPEVVANRYHALHAKNIEQLGVRYDLYWNTADPNHKRDVQEIFTTLREKGYIDERTMT